MGWVDTIRWRAKHRDESARQTALTQRLGQVQCSSLTEAHDTTNLPCERCGAAL